jgi:endonuclease-8
MPEGDTIWKTARTLRGVLAGRPVVRVRSSLPAIAALGARLALNGQSVREVTATGKHLLIYFSSGAALHTHLGMHGSWHLYRPGTPWWKPAARASVVIEADHAIAVCFDASVVELLPPGAAGRHPALRRLGPDLLAPGFDSAEARGRLRVSGTTPIGDPLRVRGQPVRRRRLAPRSHA